MGAISDEIAAIWNDPNLPVDEKRRREGRVRSNRLTQSPPAVGSEFTWGEYYFRLTEPITVVNDMIRINGELRKSGTLVNANPPFYFYNPPYIVKSTKSNAEYTRTNPDGTVDRYEENPVQALIEVIKNFVSQF